MGSGHCVHTRIAVRSIAESLRGAAGLAHDLVVGSAGLRCHQSVTHALQRWLAPPACASVANT